MHPYLRYGFVENLDTVRRLPFGRLWGIRLSVTPVVWLFPLIFFALRLGLIALGPWPGLASAVYDSAVFVLAVAAGTLVHALGHILGGLLVRRPMDELLLTATRGVNLYYGDQATCPSYVHLARATGGPVLNLIAAAALLPVGPHLPTGPAADLVARLASTNLFIGTFAWLPLPSIDGEVIWREVLRWARGKQDQ